MLSLCKGKVREGFWVLSILKYFIILKIYFCQVIEIATPPDSLWLIGMARNDVLNPKRVSLLFLSA